MKDYPDAPEVQVTPNPLGVFAQSTSLFPSGEVTA
jgi:hypothetical protein